jgi:hypothetical protein
MRHRTRTLDRPAALARAAMITLLPVLAAIVAACGNGSGGSAY